MLKYMLVAIITTVMFTQVFQEVNSARILGIFPPPAPSHYILGNRLMKELGLRGHEVTMISSYRQKEPMKNYTDIVLTGFVEEMEVANKNMIDLQNQSPITVFHSFLNKTYRITEKVFQHSAIQDLAKSNQKFDLIIMEAFLSESHVVFAHHFDAPFVIVSTIGANIIVNHYTKNPAPASYCAQMLAIGDGSLGFVNRLKNTVLTILMETMLFVYHFPNQNALMHKYFPDSPHFTEIIKDRLSLVLLNSHSSISSAKPIVPNMIEIGGYHVEEPKELPKDLKEYLDNAKDGFILFSMGSNFKSTMLPEETRITLMKVFEQLPYKILWKFEDENLPGKPKNVKIVNWLPQNDILAHPNIKLFITHGGLLSSTEAVYHGVPVVGIPIFGDQKMNMANAENLGFGKAVDLKTLNCDILLNAINEVINNKNYRETARERSTILRDQPMKPIDSAMFWIEYAIRNKNAKHLKTNAVDLEWWELNNLDVFAVLGAAVLFSLYVTCWLLRKISSFCCKKKCPQEKKKTQ